MEAMQEAMEAMEAMQEAMDAMEGAMVVVQAMALDCMGEDMVVAMAEDSMV